MGVADVMSMVLWTRFFLESHGYKVDGSDIFQYNQISILLDKNGRASSSKITRHINISFFVADRVKDVEVSIKHCPKDDMVCG